MYKLIYKSVYKPLLYKSLYFEELLFRHTGNKLINIPTK